MRKKVKVSAPGKLMLFGEHAVLYGYPCLVTAVDCRMSVSVEETKTNDLELNASDVGIKDYVKSIEKLGKGEVSKGARFVEAAVKNFFQRFEVASGLKVRTESDFSSQFGFGGSSAATVGIIAALANLFKKSLSRRQIFDLSYQTIIEVQGIGSGFDLAAATWGGTLYFTKGGDKVRPISHQKLPLSVGYTGIKADTSALVHQVAHLFRRKPKATGRIFSEIGSIVERATKTLKNGDFQKLGKLMDLNQKLLDKLGVGSKELTGLISAAKAAGALGAKLSGAGGGDCMITLVSEEKRRKMERAIDAAGGKVLRVQTAAEGVKIEE